MAGLQAASGTIVVARYLDPAANGGALVLDPGFDGDGVATLPASTLGIVTDLAVSPIDGTLYLSGAKDGDAAIAIVQPGAADGATTATTAVASAPGLAATDELANAIAVS